MRELKPLPAGTACRLTKFQMLTAWDCVCSLVNNSLTSQATNVAVRVALDQSDLRFQVLDNGTGVHSTDMAVIGRQNWTGTGEEGKGSSLAVIRKVSRCVSISSRFGDGTTWLAEFDKGRRKELTREQAERKSCGTTVTVWGFLWNLPVRRKLIKETSSLSTIKRGLICFSILHPHVRFSLRNDTFCKRVLVFNPPRYSSPFEAFRALVGSKCDLKGSFKELKWESSVRGSSIAGIVFSESHCNNLLQLLCVNQQPLLQAGDLQKEVSDKVRRWEQLRETRIKHPVYIFFISVPVIVPEEIQKMFNILFGTEQDHWADLLSKPRADDTLAGIVPLDSQADFTDKNEGKESFRLPNLPISGARFSIPVRSRRSDIEKKAGESRLFLKPAKLADDLSNWVNPHFRVHPNNFPVQLILEKEARRSGLGLKVKLTKEVVRSTRLLGQADDKFLASVSSSFLLLWDQHAVHERINLEFMINNIKLPDGRIRSKTLSSPFTVQLRSEEEVTAVSLASKDWGVEFAVLEDPRTLLVTEVPACLATDLKVQIQLTGQILEELAAFQLRGEILPSIPPALQSYLASKSCRGAIMFGQSLTRQTCQDLVRDLANCGAPFQCAHGRPSVSVLCDLGVARRTGGGTKLKLEKLKCY